MKKSIIPFLLIGTLTISGCSRHTGDNLEHHSHSGHTISGESLGSSPDENVETLPQIDPPSVQTGKVESPKTSSLETFTRTQVVTYTSPASDTDPIQFSLSVRDGVIVSASATPQSDNQISKNFQQIFSENISSKVVGKKIKDLNIDIIGGASLTTKAFEDFVRSF